MAANIGEEANAPGMDTRLTMGNVAATLDGPQISADTTPCEAKKAPPNAPYKKQNAKMDDSVVQTLHTQRQVAASIVVNLNMNILSLNASATGLNTMRPTEDPMPSMANVNAPNDASNPSPVAICGRKVYGVKKPI